MAKYDIQGETFTSLAGKLKDLESELPEDEKGLLLAILSLAEQQMRAAEDQDVSGYGFGGGSAIGGGPVQVSNIGGLRQGFDGPFGGFSGGGLGGGGQRSIVIDVFSIDV